MTAQYIGADKYSLSLGINTCVLDIDFIRAIQNYNFNTMKEDTITYDELEELLFESQANHQATKEDALSELTTMHKNIKELIQELKGE